MRREKPRHVAQAGDLAVDVGPIAQRQHLMQPQAVKGGRVALYGVKDCCRGRVAQPDDQLRAGLDLIEDSVCCALLLP